MRQSSLVGGIIFAGKMFDERSKESAVFGRAFFDAIFYFCYGHTRKLTQFGDLFKGGFVPLKIHFAFKRGAFAFFTL